MLYQASLPYHPDAGTYYASLRDLPWAAWLDSGGRGRYDVLVAQPVATLVTRGEETVIAEGAKHWSSEEDPLQLIREQLGALATPIPEIPFAGGALGYWGYDLARRYMQLPQIARDTEKVAEMAVGIYDWAVVIDHRKCTARLLSRQRHAQTAGVLPQILQRLRGAGAKTQIANEFRVHGDIKTNLNPEEYGRAFEAIRNYLHAGDCYQVNLSQRYAAQASGDAFAAYLDLRRRSPAPYAAFLDWPQLQVLCVSPELFLKVTQGSVETRPIKGTRPRSDDAAEDGRLAQQLREHGKDQAENLMIVDLLRNDLGKNCITGSVHAPKLFEVESFSNVHHLVSTVAGKLRPDRHALDLLRDCFPGGSITGAPKQRAMEIIEQLEPQRRGIYCGAIGYVGHDGCMETNIAIRTLVYARDEIRGWAGGGIVADSRCEDEYQETKDKASAMLALLRRFGGTLAERADFTTPNSSGG
ncbi:aminodeoxychorismate synthase component 1 [Ferrigenium sp. UT4]